MNVETGTYFPPENTYDFTTTAFALGHPPERSVVGRLRAENADEWCVERRHWHLNTREQCAGLAKALRDLAEALDAASDQAWPGEQEEVA